MSRSFVKIEGLREADAALADLGKSIGTAVLRRTAIEALKPVIETARGIVQANSVETGQLAESIQISTRLSKRQAKALRRAGGKDSYVEVYAGVSALPHAHLIEFGTGPRIQNTTGRFTGAQAPEPFMRPAWDQHRGGMPAEIGGLLWTQIQKATDRRAKRQARLLAAREAALGAAAE